MEWRLIEEGGDGRPGAENMALDQALFESVSAGAVPALRFYAWKPACVSLGRNQPTDWRFGRHLADETGADLVRRPTGGAAVLHDRELTYAVALPVGMLGSPRESYLAVNRALVAGLQRLGVVAGISQRRDWRNSAAVSPEVCFQAAAPGEVVVGGRKLVGSAQRRERRVLLQHGSLLLDGGQERVAELLSRQAGPAPAVTTLKQLLGHVPAWAELVPALRAGFESLGIVFGGQGLAERERRRATELIAWFSSDEWTWRR